MSQHTVLFDANVPYPAPMRDALMQLAVTDLFKATWTADIHREWIDALLRNEPHRDRAALERTRDLMDRVTRDCLVTGYEALVPALTLPDPDDRQVLAAAIVGRCDVIVKHNLKDFPPKTCALRHRDPAPRRLFLEPTVSRARSGLFRAAESSRAPQESYQKRRRGSRDPDAAGAGRNGCRPRSIR